MIVSFYGKDFKGLQNNAALVVDNASYSLVRRGVDFDDLKCVCEAFTENIQPTFLIVKNDKGQYVYAALAGIPQLTKENKTEITASDIKTMLKSDIVFNLGQKWDDVNDFLTAVFSAWNKQVNKNSFTCELKIKDNVGTVAFENLQPTAENSAVYDAWEDIFAPYLKYYGLFMTTSLDLVNKKVVFQIGKAMRRDLNIKLWELGIYDYGKWIADVNETVGCVLDTSAVNEEIKYGNQWILTSKNAVTTNEKYRDIYPIKRRVVMKETEDAAKITELLNEAEQEALEMLTESMFQENLEISNITADFETRFNITVRRGEGIYKSLPCGELHYDASGLIKVQVGYRFTGLQFIL